jgi:hypothetical protein
VSGTIVFVTASGLFVDASRTHDKIDREKFKDIWQHIAEIIKADRQCHYISLMAVYLLLLRWVGHRGQSILTPTI